MTDGAEYLILLRPFRHMTSRYAGFEHDITIAYCVTSTQYVRTTIATNYGVYVASTMVAATSTSNIGRYELRVGNMDVKTRYKITKALRLRVKKNFEFRKNFEYVKNGPCY